MKTVVWKHHLPGETTALELVTGARVLTVAEQHGAMCLWEAHDAGIRATERRTFTFAKTGHAADVDPGRYVGTVLADGGAFVLHLFETTEPESAAVRAYLPGHVQEARA